MPKLQTACTVPITDGMIVTSESDEVKQARKATIELLLGNHPLDCPVCDAGGECELQDMTFTYGAAESKFMEAKLHKEDRKSTRLNSSHQIISYAVFCLKKKKKKKTKINDR